MSKAVAALSSPFVDDEPANRRAWDRYPCEQQGVCRALANSHSGGLWPAKVRDISSGGLSLFMSRRFEVGTMLVVEVGNTSGDESVLLLARVIRISERMRGEWVMGCVLSKQLGMNDLIGLVKYPYQTSLTPVHAA